MANEWNPETVFEVLADERARQVLVATKETPQSAQTLVEMCDGSLSSIYRRINVLVEYRFLEEEAKVDPKGYHYNTYRPNYENISIEITNTEIKAELGEAEYNEQRVHAQPRD
jgi:predicted transcriptional regulator